MMQQARLKPIKPTAQQAQASQVQVHLERQALLGLMASSVAHDLNNLLTVVLGNTNLAHRHIQSPEKIKVYLARIEEASKSATTLCQQMLGFAGGHSVRQEKRAHMPSVVQGMLCLLQASLHKHVHIKLDIEHVIPHVALEVSQIQQVVMNLVMNANQALHDQASGEIAVAVGVMNVNQTTAHHMPDIEGDGEYVYIEVKDNGCGIPDDIQHKIFSPLFTTKPSGSGLGLHIVLSIVYVSNK